ncbi:MAG: protein kinase [Planctomycetes bacterium]|nr:protein kinase [Planctomycetota bacterium]
MARSEPTHWKRVKELFESTLDLPEPERNSRLRAACDGDEGLLAEVIALHEADGRSDEELEPPLREDLEARASIEPGLCLGPYRIEERIGAGGMGSVWRASRADGSFEREVAIKIVKRGMDTEAVLRRFRVERQVLARLDHPGIARLLDGGATVDGLPYLVMEHVIGVPIDSYCDEHRLGVFERLDLFIRVCSAVQHAHACGVVHRDLKPGNVLVTHEGRPKLLDFGIAKILRDEPEHELDATSPAERLLTPEYASPEQIEGGAVTPAADVHGLGVMLFELLTGRRPFRPASACTADVVEAVRQVDAPRPSTVVLQKVAEVELPRRTQILDREALADLRGASPRQLRAALEGDLDSIVLQSLQKQPERRYPDAGTLRDDIERHMRGLPVLAHPEHLMRRALRFARRHRAGVVAGAVVLVILTVATLISAALYLDARRQRAAAERSGYHARVGAALAALEAGDVVRARGHIEAAPQGIGGFELRHILARIDRSEMVVEPLADELVDFVADDDVTGALVGGERGTLAWVDLDSQSVRRTWRGLGGIVRPAALDVTEGRAAVLVEGVAFVGLDLATGAEIWRFADATARALAVDAGTRRIACGGRDGSITLRAPADGRVLARWRTGGTDVQALQFSADGRVLASGSADGVVQSWDLTEDPPRGSAWRLANVWDLAFDPSGTLLVAALDDGRVARIRLASGEVDFLSTRLRRRVASVAFSPDGRELIAASYDRAIHVWSADGSERRLLGHTGAVEGAAWRPGGGILSVSRDGTLRVWPGGSDDVRHWRVEPGWYMGLAVPRDGVEVVTSGGWPGLGVPCVAAWDAVTGARSWSRTTPGTAIDCVAADSRATRVATGTEVGAWRLSSGTSGVGVLEVTGHDAPILDVAFAPGGGVLATASRDGTVGLWDLARGGRPLGRLTGHTQAVSSVRFAPDGERILTGSWDRSARIWSAASFDVLVTFDGHTAEIWQSVFDATGQRIATASWDGTVRIWRASDGALLHVLAGHSGRVYCAAFSPDGTRLATGAEDFLVVLWDTERGVEVAALRGHAARVDKVAFGPDGDALYSLSIDGDLRRWDAPRAR